MATFETFAAKCAAGIAVDILVGIGNNDIHLILRKLAEAKCLPKRTPPILTIKPCSTPRPSTFFSRAMIMI